MDRLLEKLKLMLGYSDTEQDELLQLLLDQTSQFICNYCRLEQVPEPLEPTLLNMCADRFQRGDYGQAEKQGLLNSIQEGDVSLGYSYDTSLWQEQGISQFQEQLNLFRKAGW